MDISRYAPLVRSMAWRYCGAGLEREDLEQEGWLALIEASKDYCPNLGAKPAFYRSRVRAALVRVLRKYRRDGLSNTARGEHEPSCPGPRYSLLREALSNLPLRQRQVLILYYLHGFSLKEISQLMGIGISSAHTHKRRGLDSLAKFMSEK